MRFWKCWLIAFVWVGFYNITIFAANIFGKEPWPVTSDWLHVIGTALYIIAGYPQDVAEIVVLSPAVDALGIGGMLRDIALFGAVATFWSMIIYEGIKLGRFVYQRGRLAAVTWRHTSEG